MVILNLGCGTKTSDHPSVVNIDWSMLLRLRGSPFLFDSVKFFIDKERRKTLEKMPRNILVHDLKKGIPFSDDSVDAVYHSHMFEHLDQKIAERFLLEVKRVLKKGGVHRIVVPDFELLCKRYEEHISVATLNEIEAQKHDSYISEIIEQSVRREAVGTSKQKKIRRFLENLIFGDARQRGETHQWMYDRINLVQKLKNAGYREEILQTFNESNIPDWNVIGLDLDDAGNQYKMDSLFVEAIK
jgi:ubiquinone/menaquinone biosynthesis C-methylase UbiE